MARPVMNPLLVPSSTPSPSSPSECNRLSSRRGQSSCSTSISACGGAKNGTGSTALLAVSPSQTANSTGNSASHLPACRTRAPRARQ